MVLQCSQASRFPEKNDNDTLTLVTMSHQPWWVLQSVNHKKKIYQETMLLGCSHQKAQSHSPLNFKLAKSNKAPEIFDVIFSLNSCQPRTGTVRAPPTNLRCWKILPPTSLHFPSSGAWQRLPSPPTYCTWGCLQLAQPQEGLGRFLISLSASHLFASYVITLTEPQKVPVWWRC